MTSMPGERASVVRRYLDELHNKNNSAIRGELAEYDPEPRGDIFRSAFPDAKLSIEYQVEAGDDVITRYVLTGTHSGEYFGVAATNKEVSVTAIFIHRVRDGKIVERWGASDGLGVLQQIGAVPGPGRSVQDSSSDASNAQLDRQ